MITQNKQKKIVQIGEMQETTDIKHYEISNRVYNPVGISPTITVFLPALPKIIVKRKNQNG